MDKKYVAYIGSYTFHGSSKGISILDLDEKSGRLKKRSEMEVNNSSYIAVSHSKKFLYSIVDDGIATFKILPDGNLEFLGNTSIKGMRACYIYIDPDDKFIFTGGYHDGKMTILRLNPDGTVGNITNEIYDRGIGSVAERNFRPHISCIQMTPDKKYICMVDLGIDQIKIYRFDYESGTTRLVDIIRCELESAPRHIIFSDDGLHMYLVSELKNYISVYNYHDEGEHPEFEFKQLVSTLGKNSSQLCAACAIKLSHDNKYLFCSNAGDNSVGIFERDDEGLLHNLCVLPISGDYPKDIVILPDDKGFISLNQDSNTLTFFNIKYDNDKDIDTDDDTENHKNNVCFVMNGLPLKLDSINCGVIIDL